MIVLLERIGRGLYPVDGVAEDEVYRLPAHEELRADLRRPTNRSLRQLRLYWAVLQLVGEGMSPPLAKEPLHQWVKLKCGELVGVPDRRTGEVTEVPGSIALDGMDEADFNAFFDNAITVICEGLTGLGRDELLAQARGMLDRGEPQ